MRRFALAFFILALTLPTAAQDGHPPLTDEYRFADLSFSIPADWVVLSAGGIYYIQNFEADAPGLALRDLESGQVQIVVNIYPTESESLSIFSLQDYVMGYHAGQIVEKLERASITPLESNFQGASKVGAWHMMATDTSLNDFLLASRQAERIYVLSALAFPGEMRVWFDTVIAVGDSLTVED